jgi:hypothetical protein
MLPVNLLGFLTPFLTQRSGAGRAKTGKLDGLRMRRAKYQSRKKGDRNASKLHFYFKCKRKVQDHNKCT